MVFNHHGFLTTMREKKYISAHYRFADFPFPHYSSWKRGNGETGNGKRETGNGEMGKWGNGL